MKIDSHIFKKQLLLLPILLIIVNLYGQDCSDMNSKVNSDYSYISDLNDLSVPLNKDWSVLFENEKAIVVALSEKNQLGYFSIIKNKNQYQIDSAHDFTNPMIHGFLKEIIPSYNVNLISKKYLHNIETVEVEFNYEVANLDEKILVEGLIYLIIKNQYTYIFMSNCEPSMKNCFFPFYKEVMKNTFFGQEWY